MVRLVGILQGNCEKESVCKSYKTLKYKGG